MNDAPPPSARPHDRAQDPWWAHDGAILRVLGDLIAHEWGRLRNGARLDPARIAPGLAVTAEEDAPDSLEADSLELLHLATAVTEFFDVRASGLEDYFLARRTLGDWVGVIRQSRERADEAIVFRTSGSTGEAKTCRHAAADLAREVAALCDLIGPRRRVIAAVPGHHIYGFLFTVLLPRALSAEVVEARGRLPGSVVEGASAGDLIVAAPEFWALGVRTGAYPVAGVLGVSATGPLSDAVRTGFAAHAPGRLFEVYGSSETGGIGWRTDLAAPFSLFNWWTLNEGRDALLHADGRAPTPLPDHVAAVGARGLTPKGRRDAAVQIGGTNVFPAHVAAVLREHPQVADAAVRPHEAGEGVRLKAFIVPQAGIDEDALRKTLAAFAGERLTPAERPKSLTFGTRVPTDALGKRTDWPVEGA